MAQPVVVTAARLDELEISFREREVGEQTSRRGVDREAMRRSRSASVRNPIGIRQHLVVENGLARVGAPFLLSLGDAGK